MNEIVFPNKVPDVVQNSKSIGELQTALRKLKLDISKSDVSRKEMGQSTIQAVATFQKQMGLPATGRVTPQTVAKLNEEVAHVFVTDNKTRTERLQKLLQHVGETIDAKELSSRVFGPSTEQALKHFQTRAGLKVDGRVSHDTVTKLRAMALAAQLNTKTQVAQLHKMLLRGVSIAKVPNAHIDTPELKKRLIGPTTQAAIKAVQQKYGLPVTGQVDPTTYDKIFSLAASVPEPPKFIKAKPAANLLTIKRVTRLNMKGQHVNGVQDVMAFLGYPIDEAEYKNAKFGKTTQDAVLAYQKQRGLPQSGHVEQTTLASLNRDVTRANPDAQNTTLAYHIRGSVRNESWSGIGAKVQVWEKLVNGQGSMLAERATLSNGFYDIRYNPPVDPATKQAKSSFSVEVRALIPNTQVPSQVLVNPNQTAWVNFTLGKYPYRGPSEFEQRTLALLKVIQPGSKISDLKETQADPQISLAAQKAKLAAEDVMKLVLSSLVSAKLQTPILVPEACYAYIAQHLPPSLNGDLLASTNEFETIDQLVELTANALIFMDGGLQDSAFDKAITLNLIPITVSLQKDAIIQALATLKQTYALQKPILIGNGSLQNLLGASSHMNSYASAVADAFLQFKSFGPEFWNYLNTHSAMFGGPDAIQDFQATVKIGHIAKNFVPMIAHIKQQIADPNNSQIKSVGDLAKLTPTDWSNMIGGIGNQVPPGTDGQTVPEQTQTYAATLTSQSEQMFPAVAFAASVSRNPSNPLPRIADIEKLFDDHPDLDLRTTNLDVYLKEKGVNVNADTLTQARVMQRVHRIAPTVAVGQVLLEQKLHNSSQIVSMGKDRFVQTLTANNQVDPKTARTVYGMAEYQYAQVLQRMTEYRYEMHRADPQAIVKYTYTPEELPAALAELPDYQLLFGSLDFCDCPHCQSVFGPAAYLADVFRYLDQHPSEIQGKSVQDLLFERRPDLGNIKLNCDNTETAMPYIDLVCEVLENAVPATPPPNYNYQTTLTSDQLRAFPENVRAAAYDTLKTADYPLDISFNLSQEESRLFLDHLGVPRWKLMETFQSTPRNAPAVPSDQSIGGEYWGLSTHEATIVSATSDNTAAKQTVYWGFNANLPEISVADFMHASRLTYSQLLDLLCVQWISPPGDPNRVRIERPNGTASTDEQKLVHLTPAILDKMHRFLRLWRHTNWAMWELDLLIRTTSVCGGEIGANTLQVLKQFATVQKRLGLSVEQTLVLYGLINTEERFQPAEPQNKIDPLYTNLFLNPAVINPVDPAFILGAPGTPQLADHHATLLAALAVTEDELGQLLEKTTGGTLDLANLSVMCRYLFLARGLGMHIQDLFALESMLGLIQSTGDSAMFASPQNTLDFFNQVDVVNMSGITVGELDFLLNYRPDSPLGLRDEVITQNVGALREALRSNASNSVEGTTIAQVASTFSLPPEQAQLLLSSGTLAGQPMLTYLTTNAALTERDGTGAYTTPITEANFPDIYNVYRKIYKATMLIGRLHINTTDLGWLLGNPALGQFLNPVDLPVKSGAAALCTNFIALCQWMDFKGQFPEPDNVSLRGIFDLASNSASTEPDIKAAIATLTQWSADNLNDVTTGLGIQHTGSNVTVSDYAHIDTYLRLEACFRQINRIGVSGSTLLSWVQRDDETNDRQSVTAQQIKQTAKSKYDDNVWLQKVTPMEDVLREKKRDSLVSYLVENSRRTVSPTVTLNGKTYANPSFWQNTDDLLSYYLIDVQMGACQLTSRIKQAMSSAQMYVQRCLLGVEKPFVEVSRAEQQDTVSDNSWNQWKWMKNYRVWEANRKVFLYPENWLEPELRDNKSPFFEELETEIMQHDITAENVEAAFLHYVEKVHEVSRLDITGVYYELDDTDPRDGLPPDINVLHVIGRTHTHPAVYYYRQFDLNYGEWTAWEKIDLDIQGDQVIPVVYNRQLYLFWLTFVEKPQKMKKQPAAQPSPNTNTPQVPHQLEIQLAWSLRKDSGWTAKRVSKQKLIHPWQRPLYAYNLKPRYKSRENQLWLDIYLSQSLEFNNTQFWDGNRNLYDYLTATRFQETARPWHSSSFVFDGEIVDVKMKGLNGQYNVLDGSGLPTDKLTQTTSYDFVRDNFGADGRAIQRLSGPYEIAPRLPIPDGMHYENTKLVNNKRALNAGNLNVLEHGSSRTLLTKSKSPFEVVFSQHHIAFDTAAWGQVPFFYQDNTRSFFIRPEWQQILLGYNRTLQVYEYQFYPFYHPYTALFMRELHRSGVDGLLNRRIQLSPNGFYPGNSFTFNDYGPNTGSVADSTVQTDTVDFERYGAYAIYNWEIFFHAPLLIATKLMANQRFEEAMQWFHYIFDPTNAESADVPQRYWITRPFYEQNSDAYRQQRIENLLQNINQYKDELTAWKNHPFKPDVVARYRPVAYQKSVVMKYLDNLIAWGDQLFRQDTIEEINQATTLYLLAYELLGPRPVEVPNVEHEDKSFNDLVAGSGVDDFGNSQVDVLMENFTDAPVFVTRTQDGAEPMPHLDVLYFCIPDNDRLLGYWDTIEDRLFKIRHCMNIDGVVRQLPLFEPPIDPGLLVKAAASGVDLNSVLDDVTVAAGPYRFQRVVQTAAELCTEVKALGDKLLGALEKYDAEGLALLKSTNEVQLQQAVSEVRKQQIDDATETLSSLEESLAMAQTKFGYYDSREFLNPWETVALALGGASVLLQPGIALGYALAGGLAMIPRATAGAAGFGGSPTVTVDPVDGEKISKLAESTVQVIATVANTYDKLGSLSSTVGGYWRRKDEWDFQRDLATLEIKQIERQIASAQIRVAIAQKELENQELQIAQAQSVDDYMRSKYTNQQLYDWQLRQVSSLYFQSYQLAYDMAKRAEQCFQLEIGDPSASYIQFGYWDSLKKGLLAGERLSNDIRRMESAYLRLNTRDFEVTKHISLAQFLPLSLMALKESGTCSMVLPEWLFDMDYPGHYRRRIKSVSVSIPCVVGPYTSVNCTLSLTNHGIRMDDSMTGSYGNPLIGGDTRFYKSPVPVKAIATSHAQNDAGMFELNFNDERFLPFEGAGAVSEWRIDLPQENNQFDLATISDVVLHVRYTCRASSNQTFIDAAKGNVAASLPSAGIRLLVVNQEFGSAWQRFLHPDAGLDQTLSLTIGREHLPFYARGKSNIDLTALDLIFESTSGVTFEVKGTVPGATSPSFDQTSSADAKYGGQQHLSKTGFAPNTPVLGTWQFQIKKTTDADYQSLQPGDIRNAYLILGFDAS